MNKLATKMMMSLSALTLGTTGVMFQAPTEVEASSVKYKTTENLNMRTGASTKYKRITTIPKGKAVTYVSKKGSWYKVRYGNKTGYSYAHYLKKYSNKKKPTPKKTPTAKKKSSSKAGYTKKVMDVEVTAYTFGYGANITASGKRLAVGDVAAPREIPFGSIVNIPSVEKKVGKSTLKVYDRGGAIKRLSGNKIRIDVAFPNRTKALQFGRKTYKNVPIYIKK